jgi:hypothetical protein
MRCSVVILNWNGEEMLKRYLPSVVQYTSIEGVEIVVADNGSTDNSKQVVKDFPVKWLSLGRNYGFAEGYNRALESIDSQYVVLLNSDVEVTNNWLNPLLQYLDENEDIAAVQPKILSWTRKEYFEHAGAAGGMMDRLGYPYCRGRILSSVEKDQHQYDSICSVFWTSGACMCVRTNIYKEMGGLDNDFFAHMEEIDLCWRMQCRGYRLACVPSGVVYHLGGGMLNYDSPRKTYLNFRNCLLMLYKNLPSNRLWKVLISRFFLDYLAACHLLLTGHIRNAWAVVQARYAFWKMRSSFRNRRKENIEKAIVPYPETIADRSIIFDYYFTRS